MASTCPEYVMFLDADDWLADDAASRVFETATLDELDMLTFGGWSFDQETQQLVREPYYDFTYLPADFEGRVFNLQDCLPFVFNISVSACLTAYKRDFLNRAQLRFDEDIRFEDNVFFRKAIFRAERAGLLRELVYRRRLHGGSMMRNRKGYRVDWLTAQGRIYEFLEREGASDPILDRFALEIALQTPHALDVRGQVSVVRVQDRPLQPASPSPREENPPRETAAGRPTEEAGNRSAGQTGPARRVLGRVARRLSVAVVRRIRRTAGDNPPNQE